MRRRSLFGVGLGLAVAVLPLAGRLEAQGISTPAQSATHPWAVPELVARARQEGSLTIYSSTNEGEALPLWKTFENVTGVKVNFVRGSDSALLARIALEARAGRPSWDLFDTTSDSKLPPDFLAQTDPPEAKKIIAQAHGADRRWYGVYANYNAPAYNTDHVKAADLPKTYEGFLDHKEWVGHVAINQTDDQWLSAIFSYYGADRARRLIADIVTTLKPRLVDGHLALARAVGSGDYWIALNNYVNLTVNVKLSGAPTDYWGLDPTALYFGQIGVSARSAHPNGALLGENFLLSREGQGLLTRNGRIPVRPDVPPHPADEVSKLGDRKLVATDFSPAKEREWSKTFTQLFGGR